MSENRVLMLLPLILSPSVFATHLYRGMVDSIDGRNANSKSVVLVLEKQPSFTCGWLKVGAEKTARLYGHMDEALNLIWEDGSRACLYLSWEKDFLVGNWEAVDKNAGQGRDAGFKATFSTESPEGLAAEIAEKFQSAILSVRIEYLIKQDTHGKHDFLVALARGFPQDHNFAGEVAHLSESMGVKEEAVAWYREAASRALSSGKIEWLDVYHQALGDLFGSLPDWAVQKRRERIALPPEAEAFVQPYIEKINRVGELFQQSAFKKAFALMEEVRSFAKQHFGPDHPLFYQSNVMLAAFLQSRDQYAKALPLLKAGLKSFERVFGDSHPETLILRRRLGKLHALMGCYPKALPLLKDCLEQFERILGKKHLETLETETELANLYQDMGAYQESLVLYKAVLSQRKELLGESHPDTLRSRNCLVIHSQFMGQIDEAIPFAKATLKLFETVMGENHTHTLANRQNLASLYQAAGNFEKAFSLLYTSLQQEKRKLGKNHTSTLTSQSDLALLYIAMGFYDRALPLLQDTLKQRAKLLGGEHPDTIVSRSNLALLYESLGEFVLALSFLSDALDQSKRVLGETHPNSLTCQNNLAGLFHSMGNYSKAVQLHEATLEQRTQVLGRDHPDTLASRHNLALVLVEIKEYERALSLFTANMEQSDEILGETHPQSLASRNALGMAYHAKGQFEQALPLLKATLAQRERVLGVRHPDTLASRNNLAVVHSSAKKYGRAVSLFQANLIQSEEQWGETHPLSLSSRENLAATLVLAGRNQDALELFRDHIRLINPYLMRHAKALSKRFRHQLLGKESKFRSFYLSLLANYGGAGADVEIIDFVLNRDRILRRIAMESHQLMRATRDPELQAMAEEWYRLQALYAALNWSSTNGGSLEEYKQDLEQLESKIDKIENQLAVQTSGMNPETEQLRASVLSRRLAPDQVLVVYLVFPKLEIQEDGYQFREKQLWAVTVSSSGEKPYHLVQLGPLGPISEGIRAWHQALKDYWRQDEIDELGRELYTRLWQPIAPQLAGKGTVYIVPDGPLQFLPFGALPIKHQRLDQTADLVFLDSVQDLLSPPASTIGGSPLICYAPDYNANPDPQNLRIHGPNRPHLQFSPLPGAKAEGEQITELFRRAGYHPRQLSGAGATERALAQTLRESPTSLLHIASHGFFLENLSSRRTKTHRDGFLVTFYRNHWTVAGHPYAHPLKFLPQNPLLRSGIALAGANLEDETGGGDDGLLTALEAESLNLSGTRLVVLSACETGLGEQREGEGVYGLRRAFFLAGARALLTTLWPVDDAVTRRFMERFYQLYLAGTPARQALRKVQREFRSSEHDSHPVFWAPFHLIEIPENEGAKAWEPDKLP